jgi:hypothetical protein
MAMIKGTTCLRINSKVMKNFIGIIALLFILKFQTQAQSQRGTSVVIVDPTVPSLSTLLKQISPTSKVVYLDKTSNPLGSILRILKANAPVSSLHILSEGKPGNLIFSGMSVNTVMLEDYWEALGNWKEHFNHHGDILLYGCEVAKGDAGVEFVKTMAVLTGLDIAASDNLTGSWRKGGDWFLEIKSGRIESQLAVSKKIIEQYPAVLSPSAAKR